MPSLKHGGICPKISRPVTVVSGVQAVTSIVPRPARCCRDLRDQGAAKLVPRCHHILCRLCLANERL